MTAVGRVAKESHESEFRVVLTVFSAVSVLDIPCKGGGGGCLESQESEKRSRLCRWEGVEP